MVILNILLVDIKTSKIVYLLELEDFFFTPVVNTIKDLLLLAASTHTDPLNIKILIINIIEDLLLAVNTYKDPLVLKQITYI